MCVTSAPARIVGTKTVTYATTLDDQPVHINFYQNQARNLSLEGNCMFLNYPGTHLDMVEGPQHTLRLMDLMTAKLETLEKVEPVRMMSFGGVSRDAVTVHEYGDYTTILAQGPADILEAIEQVRPDRRPQRTDRLEQMVYFYMAMFPKDSFSLSCFSGQVEPTHPIAVSYRPRRPEMLTAPGLDGHDGNPPEIGQLMQRDFTVGFAVEGVTTGMPVHYYGSTGSEAWAPTSVAGFVDNRPLAHNLDYAVLKSDLREGYTGYRLASRLVEPR